MQRPINCILGIVLVCLAGVAQGVEPPARTPPTMVDPSARHPVDQTPQLSADGRVLAWVRVRDLKASVCTLAAPFTGQRVELPLGPAINPLATLRLSLDGQHVFWSRDGQLWHAPLGKPGFGEPERLPVQSVLFGLQTNADGSVVAALVDGPNAPTISPSWRAVVTAIRTADGWKQQLPLTPQELGKLAEGTLLDGSGRYLIYTLDGYKQAARGPAGWAVSPLEFPGHKITPVALSADGRTMLLRGRKADEVPGRPEIINLSHVWLSQRAKDQWQAPELVLRDREVNYYNLTMSPDARWLMWVEYDRNREMKILRSRLRLMCREGNGWGETTTLVDHEGSLQFWNTALANDGTSAWTTVVNQAWKSYVCPPAGKSVYLD